MMNREDLVKVIEEYNKWKEMIGKLIDGVEALCPWSHRPVPEIPDPLTTLEILHPKVYNWISYWLWDIDEEHWPWTCTREDGSEVDLIYGDLETLKQCLKKDDLINMN